MKHTLLLLATLLTLSVPAFAQETEGSFLEHLYMPLEMGISFSSEPSQDPAYMVSTCLEYRFNRVKGWAIMGEYDEHAHSYKQPLIEEVNVIQGDAQYTDWMIGPGYRQPFSKHISGTLFTQLGFSVSTLKHVTDATGERYQFIDNRTCVPSAKLRIGLEYVFDPSLNLFIHGTYLQHLKPTQIESNEAKGFFHLSAGINFCLF